MSQSTFSIANESGAAFRGDNNAALQALASLSSGASAPGTTYAYQLWSDTTNALLKQRNAANSAWLVRGALAETFVLARSSNTILAGADYGRTFNCTSSFTQTLTAAATLADGWWCEIRNANAAGGGVITIDPNGAETIDGATTIRLEAGESCIVNCNGASFTTIGRPSSYIPLARGFIAGLTYQNNGTDSLDIAVGAARDATNAMDMVLASALTKQTNNAWAVGTAAGSLDTGAVGNSDYYLWLIKRSDTGVVDVLSSLSSTAPSMPASYDYKRLIGWFKRVGGVVVAFHTYETEGGGLEMNWDSPTLDINLANTLTTTRRTDAVKVPLNFSTEAHLNVVVGDAASSDIWIYCPDEADLAPSPSVAPLCNMRLTAGTTIAGQLKVRTSAAGLIASRADVATVDSYLVSTVGFRWARRN